MVISGDVPRTMTALRRGKKESSAGITREMRTKFIKTSMSCSGGRDPEKVVA